MRLGIVIPQGLAPSGQDLTSFVERQATGASLSFGDPRSLVPQVKKVGRMGKSATTVQRLPPPGQARWAADVVRGGLGSQRR
ncbi:MAG: hypothetical protein WCO42_10045 [bacterium]